MADFHEKSLPTAAAMLAMISVQSGAAVGKSLFPMVGAEGVAALRLGIASLILVATFQPWRAKYSIDWKNLLGYGFVLGLMNLLIYRAFVYIPMSIAISIEVMGPLGVALYSSRRPLDLLWVGLALLGLILLPLGAMDGGLDVRGVWFAIAAAISWGLYVVYGARIAEGGGQAVACGMLIAAIFAVPLGVFVAGNSLLNPDTLWMGLCVALLSSAIPFLLDIFAMRRLPSYVFGVLMSASPAVSAVAAWLVLGEKLTPVQCLGVASIMLACAGGSLRVQMRRDSPNRATD